MPAVVSVDLDTDGRITFISTQDADILQPPKCASGILQQRRCSHSFPSQSILIDAVPSPFELHPLDHDDNQMWYFEPSVKEIPEDAERVVAPSNVSFRPMKYTFLITFHTSSAGSTSRFPAFKGSNPTTVSSQSHCVPHPVSGSHVTDLRGLTVGIVFVLSEDDGATSPMGVTEVLSLAQLLTVLPDANTQSMDEGRV